MWQQHLKRRDIACGGGMAAGTHFAAYHRATRGGPREPPIPGEHKVEEIACNQSDTVGYTFVLGTQVTPIGRERGNSQQ